MSGIWYFNFELYGTNTSNLTNISQCTLIHSGLFPFIYHTDNIALVNESDNMQGVINRINLRLPDLLNIGKIIGLSGYSNYLSTVSSIFPHIDTSINTMGFDYTVLVNRDTGKVLQRRNTSVGSSNYITTYNINGDTINNQVVNTGYGDTNDFLWTNNPDGNGIDLNFLVSNTDDVSNIYTANLYRLSCNFRNASNGYYSVENTRVSKTILQNFLGANPQPIDPPTDPYSKAGDSDTGGGGGSWDDGSDPVNIPNLPSVGATNTGFISLFVPSQSQLKQVAEYMWGGLFDLSTYKRLFEDPMDCILGLSVVPVSVPTSGSASITVGNIELSGISLPVASQQYVEVDCGSLTVKPYFGSYLDYEPYTKMALFVPYSGVHTVNADDLMGRTVNLVYHIDILTGSLVAFLKCGDSVLYEFNGACSSNIPVNSINYASTIENAIRIAVNIGTTVATAGASAPLSAGAEGVSQGVAGAQNIARGVSLAGSTADGALSLKPNIDRAGSLGGTTGLLGNQTPYFIVTRPRLCKPKDQNKIKGYPAFINYFVSELVGKGYTEFDTILLQNLYLTDDEKNELDSILKGGVYL